MPATSVPDELSVPACAAVCGPGSAKMLESAVAVRYPASGPTGPDLFTHPGRLTINAPPSPGR